MALICLLPLNHLVPLDKNDVGEFCLDNELAEIPLLTFFLLFLNINIWFQQVLFEVKDLFADVEDEDGAVIACGEQLSTVL